MNWTFPRTCVRMYLCSNDGDRLRPPRPLAAGAGRAERGEALRPTGSPRRKYRVSCAPAGSGSTASPEGVMTMISTTTTAGAEARNRVPDTGLFDAVPLPSRVPSAALSLLRTARHGLAEAEVEGDPGTRYICAHLAALRAAAAI